MIELSIIVVSYNRRKLLEDCLTSVCSSLSLSSLDLVTEIIVVDNHSIDRTTAMIRQKFRQVVIIKNKQNLGYAVANNQGIKKARGEYILLLNSDTKVKKDTIKLTLEKIKNNVCVGVVGCKLLNFDGTIQQSCGYFPSPFKIFMWLSFLDDLPIINRIAKPYHVTFKGFYNKTHEVDWITGAYFLFKKKIVTDVGLFDPQVFMYVEEVEYCYRIKKRGYQIIYIPQASAYHLKGGSSGNKEAGLLAEFKGITYFYDKYYSKPAQYLVRILLKCGALLRVIFFGIIGDSEKKRTYCKFLKMAG